MEAGTGDPDLRDPVFSDLLLAGKPFFLNDLGVAPPTQAARAQELQIESFAAIPLQVQGQVVASLCLASDRRGAFDHTMRELLLDAATNISLAMERFETRDELQLALAQRTDLLHRLVDAQEQERGRIADDVHDHSVQSLAAIDLLLGLLHRELTERAPDLVPRLTHIHDAVGLVTAQLRDLLFELEPPSPDLDLASMLRDAADHVFEHASVAVSITETGEGGAATIPQTTRIQLLHIVKEALLNVAKHAHADHVTITLAHDGRGVDVEVTDDGIGIDPGIRQSPPGHRGLSGMHDRASVAGGRVTVEPSSPGTTVRIHLPLV